MSGMWHQHVLSDFRRECSEHLSGLSSEHNVYSWIDSTEQLRLQSGVHGAQRRGVRGVRGGEVQGGGGLGGLLGQVAGMLGGGQPAAAGGMAGLASMLDLDGDGNPLDDIMGMASKLTR